MLRPTLIWDGSCGFCRYFVRRWRAICGDRIEIIPYQELDGRFADIDRSDFAKAIHFVDQNRTVYTGADAMFRAHAYASQKTALLWAYSHVPGMRAVSDASYRWVARNRRRLSRLARCFVDLKHGPETYTIAHKLFLRVLAIVFFIAFVSLNVQVTGLIGQHGILPAAEFLKHAARFAPEAYWKIPSVFWFDCSDQALVTLGWVGAAASVLLCFQLASGWMLFVMLIAYLSLCAVGQRFVSFQWDSLLIETAALALFCTAWSLRPTRQLRLSLQLTKNLWLLRWLLFRLMFSSGVVKLTSGDLAWRSLSALSVHYETQPLPTVIGWLAHQLPLWVHQLAAVGMFAIELVAPWMIFLARPLRHVAALLMMGLQLAILVSGNYGFFNLLTLCLCLTLIDDRLWKKLARGPFFADSAHRSVDDEPRGRFFIRFGWIRRLAIVCLFVLGSYQFAGTLRLHMPFSASIDRIQAYVAPLRIVNSYGLFAVMTPSRPEIIIEGSMDGKNWKAYPFRYKPGHPGRMPSFILGHMPRLDWLLWFAALGHYRQHIWVTQLGQRLLQNQAQVKGLFRSIPFEDHPPQYLRFVLYDYRFSRLSDRDGPQKWWTRDQLRLYAPVLRRSPTY